MMALLIFGALILLVGAPSFAVDHDSDPYRHDGMHALPEEYNTPAAKGLYQHIVSHHINGDDANRTCSLYGAPISDGSIRMTLSTSIGAPSRRMFTQDIDIPANTFPLSPTRKGFSSVRAGSGTDVVNTSYDGEKIIYTLDRYKGSQNRTRLTAYLYTNPSMTRVLGFAVKNRKEYGDGSGNFSKTPGAIESMTSMASSYMPWGTPSTNPNFHWDCMGRINIK